MTTDAGGAPPAARKAAPKARAAKRPPRGAEGPKATKRAAPVVEEAEAHEAVAHAATVDDLEARSPQPATRPPFRGRDAELEIEVLLRSTAERRAAARRTPLSPAAPTTVRVVAGRRTTTAQRVAALLTLLLVPIAVVALMSSGGPAVAMSHADASFLGAQLVRADLRVRSQLLHLRRGSTSRALAQTRDAVLTTRSLGVEMRPFRGAAADRMRRALRLEGGWLDAVGSTLSNPRSPLRAQLLSRAAAARRALATLPGARASIAGGATQLVGYARLRERATSAPARP